MKFGWRTLLPLFTLLAMVLGVFFLSQSRFFRVKQIICKTDTGECPDYVQAELNSHLGESLFFSDFYQYGDEITHLAPFLARFELKKQFPDVIMITFFSAEPKYRYAEASGQTWLVDSAGYVIGLASTTQTNYSLVSVRGELPFHPDTREKIDPQLHAQLLSVFDALKSENFQDSPFFLLNEHEGFLKLSDGRVALFTLANAPEQLAKLNYLLKHFTFSTFKAPIAEIDLRFSQVILRDRVSSASVSAVVKP